MRTPKAFDPTTMCGASSKRCNADPPTCDHVDGDHRCRLVKGAGTKHRGGGKCKYHGGGLGGRRQSKQVQAEVLENALAKLKIAATEDPVGSLFEAVRVASWRELGLRQMLVTRKSLVDGQRADVVADMHADALDAKAKIAAMAISAGLDERIIRLAERQGEIIHRILTAALDAAGVKGEPRHRAEEVAIRELATVTPTAPDRDERN